MKVAVEIPYYALGVRGASQYGENLVRALGRKASDDRFVVFNYFFRDYDAHRARIEKLKAAPVDVDLPRWPQQLVDLAERRIGYPWVENRFLKPRNIEVFHSTGVHPIAGTPTVVTFHGAAMDMVYGLDEFFTRRVLPQLRAASRVIAVSNCLRDVLLKYCGLDPARVRVVYYGVDHEMFRPDRAEADEAVRRKRSLPERFLLCVGPFQFRDNIEHLFSLMGQRGDAQPYRGVDLVLVGGLEEYGARLVESVRDMGLEKRVHFTGFVPHAELASLYRLCTAFVHLSYFEELGAQILEASASGAAIVAARVGGVEEAAGAGAVYFNPASVDQLDAALRPVLESEARRQELRAAAVEHSRRFNWDIAAERTVEVYREAARDGNRGGG